MAIDNIIHAKFNRGIVDQRALARVDVERVAVSAETQTNWVPRTIGSMMLRPGLEYTGGTHQNRQARHIPFLKSLSDTAIIELTDSIMRVKVDEQPVERYSVSSAVSNGTFDSDLTGWTDADESGATSAWVTGGYLGLTGTRFNAAIRRQQVAVAAADRGKQHGLNIVVKRGPLQFRCGSTAGAEDFINETTLGTGEYSLAFTPTADFHLQFSARSLWQAQLDSVAVESAGDMTIASPWSTNDLETIQWDQSGDVVYIAAEGYQQRKIERLGTRSWGLVKYQPEDGPFFPINTTTNTLTCGALTGDTTLTASQSLFSEDHVGTLFRLRSVGQKVSSAINGEGQWSDTIRVVGVGNSRIFDLDITGTWTATVTLQRSLDDESSWTNVTTYTVNQDTTVNDGLDNEVAYYRIGVDTGDYTSGTATCTLEWGGGGITGTVRVTEYTSDTVVNVQVLDHIGQTTATDSWWEGIWSDVSGWPGAVSFYEGRLGWFGQDRNILSVSDAFESFDDEVLGDAAPINRTLGSGPVDRINWALPLQRLILGTESKEISVRSNTLDDALTTNNYNAKTASNQGSSRVRAQIVDSRGIYARGLQAYELEFDLGQGDYVSNPLSILVPDIGYPGVVGMAVQRQPDTRSHFLRSDGTVAMLLYNPAEKLKAWVEIETGDADGENGVVEDVFVMPGDVEDVVYYCVKRVINGGVVRYLEKWATEIEVGGEIDSTYNPQADSFMMFINNPASSTVSGLDHLEGESVVVWADGKCLTDSSGGIATFTVVSGSITLTNGGSSYSASNGIVGLPYRARFKSAKLPYAISLSSPLGARQRISDIAFILENTHNQGLKFGRDFSNMNNLPKVINGATVDDDDIHSFIDVPKVTFPGRTGVDSRFCLEANAPRPATVIAAVPGIGGYDNVP